MTYPAPVVLAGPLVRRIEKDRFWIWIATSVPCRLVCDVEIFAPSKKSGGFEKVDIRTTSKHQEVRLGESLYISLIKVLLSNKPLPLSSFVTYNLKDITDNSEITAAIKSRMREVSLDGTAPKFFVPFKNEKEKLEIFHLSCRRLRRTKQDAIRGIFADIGRSGRVTPAILIMGGDQIYADDVDGITIRQINDVQRIAFKREPFRGSRKEFASKCKLSTSESKNHLVSFTELASLYLISWSGAAQLPAYDDLRIEAGMWEKVLANVPTYMLFDDHEVSDDWLIDNQWKSGVLSSREGSAYLDDALAAYFFFQGWGNDPEQFDINDINALADHLTNRRNDPQPVTSTARWSFSIPADWPIICLDCRTKRSVSTDWEWFEYHTPDTKHRSRALEPILVSEAELTAAQSLLALQSPKNRDVAFLVTNTPIFSVDAVDRAQEAWRQISSVISKRFVDHLFLDPESWDVDPASWVELVRQLLSKQGERWVLLSGDVHFGFFAEGEFVTPSKRHIRCLQITSSPVENTSPSIMASLEYASRLDKRSSQAVFTPSGGVSLATAKMQDIERFKALVDSLARKRGAQPYVKTFHMFKRNGGGTAISSSNNFARLRINTSGLEAQLINSRGDIQNTCSWP